MRLESLEDRIVPDGQFTFLEAPFVQTLYGAYGASFGGVTFTPDGRAVVDDCDAGGSPLVRFDPVQTHMVNGSQLHNATMLSSNGGCGLVTTNGSLYSNLATGNVRLDPFSGTQSGPVFGAPGNTLGLAVDPQTGNLVYVGNDGTIRWVNAGLSTQGTFSTVVRGAYIDGIAFDPSGQFLFLSNRTSNWGGSGGFHVTILRRDGSLVQHVALGATEPDGIAFHATMPVFVVTNNTDGSLTRLNFPGNDFTNAPTIEDFAHGGFRGDLATVGPDGYLYVTQAGTRYDNHAVTSENSIVRIGPGFSQPLVQGIWLSPPSDQEVPENTPLNVALGSLQDAIIHATWQIDVNWGDGSQDDIFTDLLPGTIGARRHTFTEEGVYNVSVRATNLFHQSAVSVFRVIVDDPSLVVHNPFMVWGRPGVDTGMVPIVSFMDPGGAEALTDYSADIQWGDGTMSRGVISGPVNGVFTVSGHHSYDAINVYTITVTLHHESSLDVTAQTSADISRHGGPPAVVPPQGGDGPTARIPFALNLGSIRGDNAGPFRAAVQWGDGSWDLLTRLGTGIIPPVAHRYAAPGPHQVIVTVSDAAGASSSISFTEMVIDTPVSAGGGFRVFTMAGVDSGDDALAVFRDPAGAETAAHYSASVHWGDGTATAARIVYDGTTDLFTVVGGHRYFVPGLFNAMITIEHDSAARVTVTSTFSVAAAGVPPSNMACGSISTLPSSDTRRAVVCVPSDTAWTAALVDFVIRAEARHHPSGSSPPASLASAIDALFDDLHLV